MSNISINFKKNTIEVTKSFEKKARTYGSEEYNELINAKKEFPNYRLVIKTTKSNKSFKGMDYDFMKEYISKHEDSEKRTNELNDLIDKKLTYGEIKQWFIETYPIFEDCKTRAQWILAA
jgi:hypothetical protein